MCGVCCLMENDDEQSLNSFRSLKRFSATSYWYRRNLGWANSKQGLLDIDSDKRDELWDKSFGQVYDAIRRVNQEVGELATQAFEVIEDQIIIQQNIKEKAELENSEATKIESPVAVEPKSRVV